MAEKKKNISNFNELMKKKFKASDKSKKFEWILPDGEKFDFYLRKLPIKEFREIVGSSKEEVESGDIPFDKLSLILTRSIVDENGNRHLNDEDVEIFDYAHTDDYNELISALYDLMQSEDEEKN